MRKAWLARLNAVVLALLVAGGGSGLPVADAVFHHLQGFAPFGNRVSDGESPAAHGERCTLGVPLPAMAVAAPVAIGPRIAAVSIHPAASPRVANPNPASVPGSSRPRAPPAIG